MNKNKEQTEIVHKLSDKELKDFAELFTNIINKICIFADKHNFDRNDTFAYLANRLTIFSEITTIEHFDVSYSEQETEKLNYRIPEYYPCCVAKMDK